ncbi:MAG: hypothetical protein D3924_14950, partial [Candidatus Electrothrix sp. AR4]|nr:hypothetical protein [Candidatus Electrothrix sp. AR4]
FLYERSFFTGWAMLARKYEGFFGDLGAFPMVTRIPALQKILRDNDLRQKVLYGSDYPSIPSPAWCWQLSLEKIRALSRFSNPLERNVQVMRALGVPESFFTRAGEILPLGER